LGLVMVTANQDHGEIIQHSQEFAGQQGWQHAESQKMTCAGMNESQKMTCAGMNETEKDIVKYIDMTARGALDLQFLFCIHITLQ
jgi:hypothetical protein